MATQKQKEAVDWFLGKARTARGYRNRLFNSNPGRARGTTMIGKMYFYFYDPKTKDKMKYYDRFPLVIPIENYKDGFQNIFKRICGFRYT